MHTFIIMKLFPYGLLSHFSLEIPPNSADPDQKPHDAASDQDLH